MLKGWSWKAILGGLAVDVVGKQISKYLITISIYVFMFALALYQGKDPIDLLVAIRANKREDVIELSQQTLVYFALLASIVAEMLMDLFGGYAAAAWTPRRKIVHSTLVGFLSVGALFLIHPQSTYPPIWFRALLVVPFAFLGGWWHADRHNRRSTLHPKDSSSVS